MAKPARQLSNREIRRLFAYNHVRTAPRFHREQMQGIWIQAGAFLFFALACFASNNPLAGLGLIGSACLVVLIYLAGFLAAIADFMARDIAGRDEPIDLG